MPDAAQVAEGFFDAWTGKDFAGARALVHDDLSFEGPIDSFSDADSYLDLEETWVLGKGGGGLGFGGKGARESVDE